MAGGVVSGWSDGRFSFRLSSQDTVYAGILSPSREQTGGENTWVGEMERKEPQLQLRWESVSLKRRKMHLVTMMTGQMSSPG